MVELFKVLGDENRLRILNILMRYELCVCELEVVLDLSQSNVSRHLSKLKNVGIISASKDAQWIHYQASEKFALNNPQLIDYLKLKFKGNVVLQEDLRKCDIYKNSVFTCQNITNERQTVIGYINHAI